MKKLTRSKGNRVVLGVCGGIAEYFSIDATIIRIIWFVLALPSIGTLGLAYLVCGFIIPEDDEYIYQDGQEHSTSQNTPLFIGLGLIAIGAYLLLKIIYPQILNLSRYWPVLLILLGIYIIFSNNRSSSK